MFLMQRSGQRAAMCLVADSTAQASAEAALDAAVASRDMQQLELAIQGGEALGLTPSKNRRMQAASEALVSRVLSRAGGVWVVHGMHARRWA